MLTAGPVYASRQLFFLMALFVFFETGTCTALFAQSDPHAVKKPQILLGVLVDASAHQRNVSQFQWEVVNSIADGFANIATESFVVRYANEVETLQDWSPAGLKTVSARITLDLESVKNQRTLLYEALHSGLLKLDTRASGNSKVLIVIGEGNNTGGRIKYSEIAKQAKATHVQCFALLVADHNLMGGRVRHFGFNLYDLASTTKGKAYDVGKSRKNLEKAIKDMRERIYKGPR